MSRGSGTTWDPLQNWLIAKRVNSALGGAIVGPWDIEDFDDEIIEIAFGLIDTYPSIVKQKAAVERYLDKWRSSHPTYGRRLERLRKLREG